MKNDKYIYLLIIFTLINLIIANNTNLVLYAFTYSDTDNYYTELVKRFNEYSIQQSLDISLELNILNNANTSLTSDEIANKLDSYLKYSVKKNDNDENLDLVAYDVIYSGRFSDYFVDLKPFISKKIIDSFIPSSIDTCTTPENELISLPLYSDYGVLGYNEILLQKYNKPVPKTWNELIETAKVIITGEKEIGNNIIGYTSQHINSEAATCSDLELLYSGRKNVTDKYPLLNSSEAIQTIKILKTMIDQGVATFDSLNRSEMEVASDLWGGKTIFGRNWQYVGSICNKKTMYIIPYCLTSVKNTRIPGFYENISASVVGGHNIAIAKSSNHVKEAVKVVEFFTSYEIQKEIIEGKLPAIPKIYIDSEVCKKIDCPLYLSLQPIARPSALKDYDKYSVEFRENISKAVKGEITYEVALIRNVNIFNNNSINFKSWPSFIINGLCILLFIGCILSFLFIYYYYDSEHLCFMSTANWCAHVLGCILVLVYVTLNSGRISNNKCQFRFWLLLLGYSLSIVPIFARLMGNYPNNYGLPSYIRRNLTMVVNFILLIEMLFAFLWVVFSPFKSHIVHTNNEYNESFYICDSESVIGDLFFNCFIAINLVMTIITAYLMIIERNFPKYYLDIRNFSFIIFTSIFILIFEIILKYIDIKSIKKYYYLHTFPKLLYVGYMIFVIFGFKLYYIKKDIPAEKKTIYNNKSKFNSSSKYSYQELPEEDYYEKVPRKYSDNSIVTKYTNIDIMSDHSNNSKYSENSNKYQEYYKRHNIPNPDEGAMILNAYSHPESIIPYGSARVLLCGEDDYDYMNVDNLLELMKR
ncbi:periplasmic binding protein-like II [Piromyces finnis]|uniref:Periplasmic binding protein-like II n=1 Tax=Piromyces finnis TaxID=1754191 RepID=A0A1Y1UWE5_9FUNG|nr:periplasmic binding protein-like II [Piromyces finnis]|eukprot:ORX42465.1 periplasmic binding protein-like II [Piromyces finnis]